MFLIPLGLFISEILMVVFLINTLILQIFLSRMKKPWPGLILPGLTFGFIFLLCTFAPDFDTVWIGMTKGNIPTALYLLIYFLFRFLRRRKQRKAEQL